MAAASSAPKSENRQYAGECHWPAFSSCAKVRADSRIGRPPLRNLCAPSRPAFSYPTLWATARNLTENFCPVNFGNLPVVLCGNFCPVKTSLLVVLCGAHLPRVDTLGWGAKGRESPMVPAGGDRKCFFLSRANSLTCLFASVI